MAFASASIHVVEQVPKMAVASVYVPRVSCSCLLSLQKILLDQQVILTQASIKLRLLPWVLEHERFFMYPLRVKSLFPPDLWDSQKSPHWPSKPYALEAHLPKCRTPGLGLGPLTPLRGSAVVIIFLFVDCAPWGMGLDYFVTLPLLPILLLLRLYIFSCRSSPLVGSGLFH